MSADGSRRVRKTTLVPGRRVICATCPSTQTHPRRAIHAPSFWLTTRTGHGWSAVLFGDSSVTGSGYGPRSMGTVTGKRVLLAKPRGYCAGVDRAVQTVEQALDLYGAPIYVRKQIVHNRHVVSTLEARGAVFVEENDEVPEGAIVVFSAHGVAPEVYEQARERNLKAIDATCPLVTKVHQEARRFAADGYEILLIGHEGHEEVVGTAGEAPEHVRLVDGVDAADAVSVRDPDKVVWLSQTTLSVDETMETVARLKQRLPLLQSPPSDDICYATSNRQQVVKQIAPQCDVVLVVGSRNSSNSVRLAEVALAGGARASYLVDYAHEISDAWLDGAETVGLTSGASVPDELVMQVLDHLAERGFDEVAEVTTATERLTFSLPQELKRDMRAAAAARSAEAAELAATAEG
jgi:4-hydroxy-3-methylbut-2-en-1-yl diphosphate reductase